MPRHSPMMAFMVGVLGIALFSGMDAVMKGLVQDIGTFATMCWRQLAAVLLVAPIYLAVRKRWPTARATCCWYQTRSAWASSPWAPSRAASWTKRAA